MLLARYASEQIPFLFVSTQEYNAKIILDTRHQIPKAISSWCSVHQRRAETRSRLPTLPLLIDFGTMGNEARVRVELKLIWLGGDKDRHEWGSVLNDGALRMTKSRDTLRNVKNERTKRETDGGYFKYKRQDSLVAHA
jgi:hypothetical protein